MAQPLESTTLHRSLIAFTDVIRRLSTPAKAALAPFRTSKLTHYLSELLGGNAVVVSIRISISKSISKSIRISKSISKSISIRISISMSKSLRFKAMANSLY